MVYYIIETCQPEEVIVELKCIKRLSIPHFESKKPLEEVVYDIDHNEVQVFTATKNKVIRGSVSLKDPKVVVLHEAAIPIPDHGIDEALLPPRDIGVIKPTYSKGAKVITVKVGSKKYLRTVPDAAERNNLDSLKNYC